MRFSGLLEFSAGLANCCADWCLIKQRKTAVCLCAEASLSAQEPQRKNRLFLFQRADWGNILVVWRKNTLETHEHQNIQVKQTHQRCTPSYYFLSLFCLLSAEISSNAIHWVTRGKYRIHVRVRFATELRRYCLHTKLLCFPVSGPVVAPFCCFDPSYLIFLVDGYVYSLYSIFVLLRQEFIQILRTFLQERLLRIYISSSVKMWRQYGTEMTGWSAFLAALPSPPSSATPQSAASHNPLLTDPHVMCKVKGCQQVIIAILKLHILGESIVGGSH